MVQPLSVKTPKTEASQVPKERGTDNARTDFQKALTEALKTKGAKNKLVQKSPESDEVKPQVKQKLTIFRLKKPPGNGPENGLLGSKMLKTNGIALASDGAANNDMAETVSSRDALATTGPQREQGELSEHSTRFKRSEGTARKAGDAETASQKRNHLVTDENPDDELTTEAWIAAHLETKKPAASKYEMGQDERAMLAAGSAKAEVQNAQAAVSAVDGERLASATRENRIRPNGRIERDVAKGRKTASRKDVQHDPMLQIVAPEALQDQATGGAGDKTDEAHVREIVLELGNVSDPSSGVDRHTVSLARADQLSGLAARLRSDLPAEIVRQAQVLLKNSDSAEIRLVIRPPELGRVRIQMNLESGHIAGRILVDNGSVRDLIQQNLANLQREFEAQGLAVGQFDVESREDRQTASGDGKRGNDRTRNEAIGHFETNTVAVVDQQYDHLRVNIVA